jgi:hypothetical protein
MPITRANWENFFQGAFAEHHVCSQFYFHGYEAQKTSPDVGIDLIVTNIARTRFSSEERLSLEIQVKSALSDQTGACVAIEPDEVDFLCEGEHRYCVFVVLSDLEGRTDPEFYERGDDPDASRAVDRDWMRQRETLASAEGRAMKRQGDLSIFEFDKVEVTLFWLHSSQLRRLRDEKLLSPMKNGNLALTIQVLPQTVEVDPLSPTGAEMTIAAEIIVAGEALIPELRHLAYIAQPCKAEERIRQGHLWKSDY